MPGGAGTSRAATKAESPGRDRRRAESPPPPRPAGVNKAATRAAHLPAAAAPRPLRLGAATGSGQARRTDPGTAAAGAAGQRFGQGPRCFLRQSRRRSSGSARSGCVTSRPGSPRGRRGRDRRWVITPLCGHFTPAQRSGQGVRPPYGWRRRLAKKRLLGERSWHRRGLSPTSPRVRILESRGFCCFFWGTLLTSLQFWPPEREKTPVVRGVDKGLMFRGRCLIEGELGLRQQAGPGDFHLGRFEEPRQASALSVAQFAA